MRQIRNAPDHEAVPLVLVNAKILRIGLRIARDFFRRTIRLAGSLGRRAQLMAVLDKAMERAQKETRSTQPLHSRPNSLIATSAIGGWVERVRAVRGCLEPDP